VCSPTLSEGLSARKAVGPPMVEKDRVLRGYVSFTCREECDVPPLKRMVGPNLDHYGVPLLK
jgi:hypothetical protein